ncbi:hypothetical protein [Staphylococcus debuckii]|uniref:hypothetical protein n=1 Tax=Staphylococcus debuckii TaxID=2044912 RepID=UPI000F4374B8|nr:hypothetical protein [Staphylococcus debuckii]AYU54173.1 hypothetical protein CNQ82_01460 [Staphylococcus debuckii]
MKKILSIFIFLFLVCGIGFTGYLAFTDDSNQKTHKDHSEKKDAKKEPKKDKKDSEDKQQNTETEATVSTEPVYGTDYNEQNVAPAPSNYDTQGAENAETSVNAPATNDETGTAVNSGYDGQAAGDENVATDSGQ